jgi:hypothetical protein
MMVLFQYLAFLHIEDLDLHNLAVKKASSLLLMPLDYFYQITCKYIPVVLLMHLKAKGSLFIINMTSWLSTRVVVTYDGWQMEPWYDCCGGDSICMGK